MIYRIGWCTLLVGAVVVAVMAGLVPVGEFSLGCSKENSLDGADLLNVDATCRSSTFYAFGVWPSVQIGLVLGVPAALAAVVARRWVSALAAGVYVGVDFYGIANWTSWLIVLVPAGAVFAVVAASLTVALRTKRGESVDLGADVGGGNREWVG